jgi:hypothetical protein
MGLKQFFGRTLRLVWDWDDGSISNVYLLTGTDRVPFGASNPFPVNTGAGFGASGVTPVSGTVSAAGSTAGLSPKAGRSAYLWLSGGTSASGYLEYSSDGTNWFALFVEGSQVGTFSYAAAGAKQIIPIPPVDQAALQVRATFTAVSGTVSYALSQ